MAENESDQWRGVGRDLRRDLRGTAGEAEFRAAFLQNMIPRREFCIHCDAGAGRYKLKRQYIHYIGRRAIVCGRD